MGKDTILTRRQIEGMISEGRAIIIVDCMVLRLDSWLSYHPGGERAILHMVGKDATDEVNALHGAETRLQMNKFQIGRLDADWINFLPPLHGGKFRPYVEGSNDDSLSDGESLQNDQFPLEVSRSPSPTSSSCSEDRGFLLDPSIRRRRGGSYGESSASSITSVSDEDGNPLSSESAREIAVDLAKYPSLDRDTQKRIIQKYRELDQKIRQEGLYQCRYSSYLIELCRYLILLFTSLILLHLGWYKLSAAFMGAFWHQITFTAHDAGHMGITHDFTIDTCIGIFIADFCGGLSLGWWKLSHNVHHIVTNEPEHDPDIEHLPFFAVSHLFFNNLFSTYYKRVLPYDAVAKIFVPLQNWLYYPILCFGRFNLYRLSWEYLLFGLGPKKGIAWWHRWLEISGMFVFWYWFGYQVLYKSVPTNWDRFAFVMISHIITMPLHVQITLSHFAMSTADLGVHESFPQKMLRTTMDVDCPQWLDFFHGGLQFQAIHHLFPRIPRHNLRKTQKLVIEFCKEVNVPYAIYGFVDGNREVIGHLKEIGRQARALSECHAAIIQEGKFGSH
ncbi:fatty acid desaturase-domain-containing protein [Kalaharituber pfeilii]|nr:fatty acid desaturase-domain-containing protein [Kalaharituber pfeilii]